MTSGIELATFRFQDNRHVKLIRLSALRTGRLYHQQNIPEGLCQLKNFNDVGNRTRDLQLCSAVPQPTAPLRTPHSLMVVGRK